MTVREIRPFGRRRSEVLTDEGLRFVLYDSEIVEFQLAEDEEIPPQTLQLILTELLPKRAKMRAMNLLKERDYTQERLKSKLAAGGYPPAVVDEALAYVLSYHYVDDARYANEYIRCHMERYSRARIRGELQKRGIDARLADEAMERLYADETLAPVDPEILQIRKWIDKKHFHAAEATWEERQRFLASMVRRGFSPDKVKTEINMAIND